MFGWMGGTMPVDLALIEGIIKDKIRAMLKFTRFHTQ